MTANILGKGLAARPARFGGSRRPAAAAAATEHVIPVRARGVGGGLRNWRGAGDAWPGRARDRARRGGKRLASDDRSALSIGCAGRGRDRVRCRGDDGALVARPATPAAVIRSPRRVPASSAGDGLVLVVNTGAGTVSSKLVQWLRAVLPQAVLIETAPGQGFVAQLRLAAAKARILGVAGGDGTVSTASAVALEHGLPLLVIPAGTFNHFAADLGIRSAHDAVTALTDG
jgi:hypothetical protein